MIRLLALSFFLFLCLLSYSKVIPVKNIEELNNANKNAIPGDTIILQNGEWKNVTISLDCIGTKEKSIVFKAQTAGKVLITGNSKLKIGGQYIIVDGLYFVNGYAGKDAVITFRTDNKHLANDCRVTNTVINDFNNPKRMDENNWITFFGKNNRLDHCSFIDKKNMGVLLAVILDDERSRENFHSIDHNYFGRRLPLASNGGEMIRVGLSQHCRFNSNTHINNNFFEDCDGEAEIISIKSCANEVKGNVFKECQGSVVLRHGDNNIVMNNYFLGNDKAGSGGVRVINKGQKVSNNIFYKCRGVDFRSPLVIMNGVPNSPPTRYVQVTNAEIADNIFYECSPISLCEGSDAERTLPPDNVTFSNNAFYNTRDSIIYNAYDDIKGIHFTSNKVSDKINQPLADGFTKTVLPLSVNNIPIAEKQVYTNSGTNWFKKYTASNSKKTIFINCLTAEEIYKQLERKEEVTIQLTGKEYKINKPFVISKSVQFKSDKKSSIVFETENILSVFILSGKGNLTLNNIHIDGKNVNANQFISSDSNGYSDHYNLIINNCSFQNFNRDNGCQTIFYAFKSMMADSIVVHNNLFINNNCNFFSMKDEKEDKGYYNAEKIIIGHNNFNSQNGTLLNVYRGGSDESTLGPNLIFSHNKLSNCSATDPLITLTGVQVSNIFSNNFSKCNPTSTLVFYKDIVRARHNFERNTLTNSGKIEKNVFVVEKGNTMK
ncbi:MAG TPA: polysaccharide lyase 6 family protein [Chitinophagaceae bacterium]|nr:polysaccharide lyase 6 family protein [Chitinophagaceae bacterium]